MRWLCEVVCNERKIIYLFTWQIWTPLRCLHDMQESKSIQRWVREVDTQEKSGQQNVQEVEEKRGRNGIPTVAWSRRNKKYSTMHDVLQPKRARGGS